jgi:hypothetical protein
MKICAYYQQSYFPWLAKHLLETSVKNEIIYQVNNVMIEIIEGHNKMLLP